MLRMQHSGYTTTHFRGQVLDSALKAYEKIKTANDSNVKPMYRSKEWKSNERQREKRRKKSNWYKNKKGNTYKSVLFVPATPNSELKKIYEEEVKQSGLGIKIVERAGVQVKNLLQKSYPFQHIPCEDECFVCETNDGKINCRKANVTYELECKECGFKYIGETHRTIKIRANEHLQQFKNKDKDSVMMRHLTEKHDGQPTSWKVNLTGQYADTLTRQLSEAIKIKRADPENMINNRMEFNHNLLSTISISRT